MPLKRIKKLKLNKFNQFSKNIKMLMIKKMKTKIKVSISNKI